MLSNNSVGCQLQTVTRQKGTKYGYSKMSLQPKEVIRMKDSEQLNSRE